jgi:hypothetical protein
MGAFVTGMAKRPGLRVLAWYGGTENCYLKRVLRAIWQKDMENIGDIWKVSRVRLRVLITTIFEDLILLSGGGTPSYGPQT